MSLNTFDLTASLQAATLVESAGRIVPLSQDLPTTLTRSYTVGGVVTDITVQLFCDRIVVTCSQLEGRIGHWLLCKATTAVASIDPFSNPAKVDWDVSHILGAARDDPLLTVYAKRVTDRIYQTSLQRKANDPTTSPPTVLLGISLRAAGKDPAVFHTIVDLLANVYQEAIATRR